MLPWRPIDGEKKRMKATQHNFGFEWTVEIGAHAGDGAGDTPPAALAEL
uniref:Uncharacterized protein n=1 Tax=Nelumbo nucifera TaxID=4432 RepID=A0A822YZU1_NELNU|nr:TPA_asm: hypothetical protein HUJ06_006916 [Nelumbo nucifera]